jgi:serine/threonine-protein kinase
LIARIGQGGMGVVYRAQHIHMRKAFAVKLLDPELGRMEEISKRFTREAETSSRLSHPNIVQVTDFGRNWNETLFLVMELIPGESLAALMARKEQLSLDRALRVGQQILNALAHAHGQGVIHRDLKPENVMLLAQPGRADMVKLLDFGIARILNPGRSEPNLTQAGAVFGTPEYMSPEQAKGETADARSDLYACGVLLYQMIVGQRPFNSPDPVKVLQMQILDNPPSLREAAPDRLRPPSIDAAIARALEKDPAKRFASAGEMAEALESSRSALRAATTIRLLPSHARRWAEQAFGRSHRLLHQAWTTLCLPRLRRLWTTSIQRFRALSPNVRRVAGVGAGAAMVLVLAVLASPGERPAAPATVSASIVTPSPSDPARLQLLLGSIEFLERRVEAGLLSYRAALRLDPSLSTDPTLLANVAAAASDKRFAPLAIQVLESVGTPSCASLAELASSEHGVARRAARKACRRLECDSPCAAAPEPPRPRSRREPARGTLRPLFAR